MEEIRAPDRDQSATRKALAELRTLKARYPDSAQARDADNRIRLCEDSLAAAEMIVARSYLNKKQYLAAKNRFEVVAREHQNTAHVEEALMRITEVNMALGLREEAQNAAAVLGHNFPDSPWYKDAYTLLATDGLQPREDSSSWLSRAWKNVKLPKMTLGGLVQ
jgi:outer membrane protein assembly factor BamD